MSSTFFNKSLTKKIKQSKVSPYKARHLKRAIVEIDTIPVDDLCKTGRAKKLKVAGQDNLYAYRLSSSDRILFSLIDGKKIVHDIVDTDSMKSQAHIVK